MAGFKYLGLGVELEYLGLGVELQQLLPVTVSGACDANRSGAQAGATLREPASELSVGGSGPRGLGGAGRRQIVTHD